MKTLINYKNEDEYIKHQKSKTTNPRQQGVFKKNHKKRTKIFLIRFKDIKVPKGSRVLCLGARFGDEVEAWNTLGMSAIGIDIVPFLPLVIEGDFHHLQFGSDTFDVVYSNSIDHSNNPARFMSEATRVTKKGGLVVIDFRIGMDGAFEVTSYKDHTDIVNLAPNLKFLGVNKSLHRMYKKVNEQQLIFRKE